MVDIAKESLELKEEASQTEDLPQYRRLNTIVFESIKLRRTKSGRDPTIQIGEEDSIVKRENTQKAEESAESLVSQPVSDSSDLIDLNSISEDTAKLYGTESDEWRRGFASGLNTRPILDLQSISTQTDAIAQIRATGVPNPAQLIVKFLRGNADSVSNNSNSSLEWPLTAFPKSHSMKEPSKPVDQSSLRSNPIHRDSSLKFIASFICQHERKIQKYAVLSKKHILRQICYLFYVAKQQSKSLEASVSPCSFIVEALTYKYSKPDIAQRKYKEFVASGVMYYENTRIKLFLRAAGAGKLVYEKNLTVEGCILLVNCYTFMLGSGVTVDDTQLFPFSKSHECAKEHVEKLITKTEFHYLMSKLNSLCVEDPNKLSRTGFIDVDLFVEQVITFYENFCDGVLEGINALVFDFFTGSPLLFAKNEFAMALRAIHSNEDWAAVLAELDEAPDEYTNELTTAPELYYSVDKLKKFCVSHRIMHINDINKLLNMESITEQDIEQLVKRELPFIEDTIKQLGSVDVDKHRTISQENWRDKVAVLESYIQDSADHAALFICRILSAELYYLQGKY